MIPNCREVYSTNIVVRTESSQLSLTLYVAVMRLLPYGSRVHLGGLITRLVEHIAKGGVLKQFQPSTSGGKRMAVVVLFRATSLISFQQSLTPARMPIDCNHYLSICSCKGTNIFRIGKEKFQTFLHFAENEVGNFTIQHL